MSVIRFESGTNILQFSQNISLPVSRPREKMQVRDRDASGGLHVEELGDDINKRYLFFKTLPKVDHDQLEIWYDTIANGAMNAFTFIDERGVSMLVKIISPTFDFKEFFEGWYTGTLVLEVQK